MKHHILSVGLLAALAFSCAVNEIDSSKSDRLSSEVFYAQFENPCSDPSTRVYATEDLYIRWNADDRITIFNKYTYNQEYRFNGETGDNSGSFKRVDNGDFVTGNYLENIYAIYPYLESTRISDTGVMTVTLPAEQKYAENTFGLGANTMISATTDNQLMFKNVGGYLMLKLYGEDVTVSSISLKGNNGEKLSGKATITMPVDGIPSVEMANDAGEEITLVCDKPVKIGTTPETATTFWLVVPPTTFEGGITLKVKTADGKQFEKSTTGRLDISRNTRSTMAALEVVPVDLPFSRYLTFSSEGTTTLSLTNYKDNAPKLYYSTDQATWTQWDYSELTFTGEQPLYLRGDNPEGFSSSSTKYSKFVTAGDNYSVSGDIMSLIDSAHELTIIPCYHCFRSLFMDCAGLTTAPDLPATTLAQHCYELMFNGCTSLATAPDLPATTLALAYSCYEGMFRGCSSLTTAPDLPATTLANSCYVMMFLGCTGLTTAPDLPATTLAQHCYHSMFNGCTGLTTAPDLPATTLAQDCYDLMFYGCSQLNYVKCLATDISATNCVFEWLSNVASTGTFVKAPDMHDWLKGANGIPAGWTVVSCPEAVDLGLSVKWASFNLGAFKPEEYGNYYAWGETEPYHEEGYGQENPCTHWRSRMEPAITGYNWASYKWCMGSQKTQTKYCTNSSYGYNGFMDGKTVLDPEDDAAHVALVGNWRMPTDSEWTELRDNCTWEWTDNYNETGVAGRIVTSKVEGHKDKSIFLPAAGIRDNTDLYNAGSNGYYWSSSLHTGNQDGAWGVYFHSDNVYRGGRSRYDGLSVRPVYAE